MLVLVLVLMCMVVVLMRLVASFPVLYLLPSLALLALLVLLRLPVPALRLSPGRAPSLPGADVVACRP
ncbi:hypothetical protein [Glycomyces sp. YM15]|uniref:hypothetical protein n=1 Tax=Glycomyces sp. YM15 TaxID=2800446 RepID=UPI001965959E|nr:hypothetical protein [Glycomyces sp. YM15]